MNLNKSRTFEELQNKLRACWTEIEKTHFFGSDILVVPSITLDERDAKKVTGFHHLEERLLPPCLAWLKKPNVRLFYIMSQPLHPSILNYYAKTMLDVSSINECDNFICLSICDSSPKALTQKILERPRFIQELRQKLNLDRAFMVSYNSTNMECSLSEQLGIPVVASSPNLSFLGTKAGSRQIFSDCQILHPPGSRLIYNISDLSESIACLWENSPGLKKVIIKLNEGFIGLGNAILSLKIIFDDDLAQISHKVLVKKIEQNLHFLQFQAQNETWDTFKNRILESGAIVEEFLEGIDKQSPSFQGCIMPSGEVKILSTQEQVFMNPESQTFIGSHFPANIEYQKILCRLGLSIGKNLAEKGALDCFSVDFIAFKKLSDTNSYFWELNAIEINLRKGGTTHPILILQSLTNGFMNEDTIFYSQSGKPKYYISSDNLKKDIYKGLLPNQLIDIIEYHHLNYDSHSEKGIVFYLMSSLSEFGRFGMMSIGNSMKEATDIYDKAIVAINKEVSPLVNLVMN
ncbi:MAG: carboxylate-amine ligase [Trichodesmium sp. MAG_R04]|jgi:hypothetical protein|nr:carboxylate-amine ligase [Trichodesmium sp. MAG_R04]